MKLIKVEARTLKVGDLMVDRDNMLKVEHIDSSEPPYTDVTVSLVGQIVRLYEKAEVAVIDNGQKLVVGVE
jgi:hypothetical protein